MKLLVQREGLEGLLVEEVRAFAVGVEVGGGDELEVGLFELVLGLEGLLEDGVGEKVAHLEADEGLASACGGGGDVGVEADVRGVLVFEKLGVKQPRLRRRLSRPSRRQPAELPRRWS